ncbi:MAG: hypothetical protein P8Z00_12930 [Anaerolineales bacterium]
MNEPLMVEIIAYAPTAFYHCTHCEVAWREMGASNRIHKEQVASSLPPDLAEDYQAISDWVREIFRIYCDQILVKVIDAASLEGFIKTLRFGIHNYPAIILNGEKFTGNDALHHANEAIAVLLQPGQTVTT